MRAAAQRALQNLWTSAAPANATQVPTGASERSPAAKAATLARTTALVY